MSSVIGSLDAYYTKGGLLRYRVAVKHSGLNKFQEFKGESSCVVASRANAAAARWDEQWQRKLAADAQRQEREKAAREVEVSKEYAAELTLQAQKVRDKLEKLLLSAIERSNAVDWEALKDKATYSVPKPKKDSYPNHPAKAPYPIKPMADFSKYAPKIGFFDFFSKEKKQLRINEAKALLATDLKEWKDAVARIDADHAGDIEKHQERCREIDEQHVKLCEDWGKAKVDFLQRQEENNAAVDARKQQFTLGDVCAVEDYFSMVLDNSQYPDSFPKSFELEYNPANAVLILEYQLPNLNEIPTLAEVKFIVSRNDFNEKHLSNPQRNKLYDEIIYQIALRTVYELFDSDTEDHVAMVAFNGWVDSIDSATGKNTRACILSLQVEKKEFTSLSLENVEPRACFRSLKGVSASKLHTLSAVAPILEMTKDDSRFVASRDVADAINTDDNLAAMDWEDFEHLIRELFEKEYSSERTEIKVTQASRDGGIDAVIFNNDPLHGGKIVIQAKRYTNTVGVSAIRDLWGSTMNEGATKGILVTTSDFGPDSYDFVKDKPLVLINGSNLLHLLEKHGHKARIDLQEAKQILADK